MATRLVEYHVPGVGPITFDMQPAVVVDTPERNGPVEFVATERAEKIRTAKVIDVQAEMAWLEEFQAMARLARIRAREHGRKLAADLSADAAHADVDFFAAALTFLAGLVLGVLLSL